MGLCGKYGAIDGVREGALRASSPSSLLTRGKSPRNAADSPKEERPISRCNLKKGTTATPTPRFLG